MSSGQGRLARFGIQTYASFGLPVRFWSRSDLRPTFFESEEQPHVKEVNVAAETLRFMCDPPTASTGPVARATGHTASGSVRDILIHDVKDRGPRRSRTGRVV